MFKIFGSKADTAEYAPKHLAKDGELSTMEQVAQQVSARAQLTTQDVPVYVPSQEINTTKIIEQPAKHASNEVAELSDIEPRHAWREDYSPTKPVGTAPVVHEWLANQRM